MFCDKCGTPITSGAQSAAPAARRLARRPSRRKPPQAGSRCCDGRSEAHSDSGEPLLAHRVLRLVRSAGFFHRGQMLPF